MRVWTLLIGLGALIALAAVALGPAGAQEPAEPGEVELLLSLVDEADAVVPAGSTLRVAAQLRLEPWEEDLSVSAGNLWLLGTSPAQGAQVWEAADGSRLTVGNQRLLKAATQTQASGTGIVGTGSGNGNELRVIAYDGKTAVARGRNHRLYVFNTETGAQLSNLRSATWRAGNSQYCILIDSSCNGDGQSEWGWGRQSDDQLGGAVAVWQESDNRAWLFVGNFRASIRQSAYNYLRSGALWIYEVNYANDPPTVTQRRAIHSLRVEVLSRGIITGNGHGTPDTGHYGTAVAVSADGSTLAVGAPRMHNVGAVYVYSRPAGGWGATLGWNDAVRVEPVAIPAWGHNNSHHPFQPQSTGRTDGRTDCDAYCSAVSSYAADVVDGNNEAAGARFGASVALSADGSVLAVSAPRKRWASTTPGGSGVFRGTSRAEHGEVLIFTAPAGGWSSVPNYKTSRSHLAWNANAANFDPSMHYNTGPNKRVVEPTWTFSFPWDNQQAYRLGQQLALSEDGTVLAANDRINDAVNLFEVDSPSDWANGPTAPTAQLRGVTDGGLAGEIGFSPDGLTFAIGDPAHNSNQGRVLLFERPTGAANSMRTWLEWADADAANAEILLAPAAQRVANDRFGRTLVWSGGTDPAAPLRGSLAIGASEGDTNDGYQSANDAGPGRFWTVSRESPLRCPRTERTDAEGTMRRTVCTLELGDTRVIIPGGTPDGTFTIEGSVTVGYGDEGRTLTRTARLEVEIGTVREAASAALEFGVDDRGTPFDVRDDRPQPGVLNARGESTLLRLRLLNERDKPSTPGAVSSVVITTTVGSLSTTFGGGCRNGGGHACELNVSALTTSNTGNIPLTLTHAGAGGTASVEVLATAKASGRTYESEPLAVVLAGTAASLSIAEATGALLNVNTDDGVRTPDNRDVLELIVTARDALGHATLVPTQGTSYRITGPDGRSVPTSKIAVQWPLNSTHCATGGTNPAGPHLLSLTLGQHTGLLYASAKAYIESVTGAGLCVASGFLVPGVTLRAWDAQMDDDIAIAFENTVFRIDGAPAREFERDDLRSKVRLNVDATADEPLAAGEYTIELRAGAGGALTARQTFLVSGGAAALTLSEPEGRLVIGERISVTATVADADGNAVADGTPVEWEALDAGAGAVLVQISANPITTDGMAGAIWQVVGPGTSTVKATAGDAGAAANARLVTVPLVVAPPPPPVELAPIEYLSSRVPGRLSAWNGEGTTKASVLLPELEGVSGLLLWRPEGWLRYAVTSAGEVPGSVDFEVTRGAVLWLSE